MDKILAGIGAVALVFVGAAGAIGMAQAQTQTYGCPHMGGMMGPGMMGPGMMGPGMMGSYGAPQGNVEVSVDNVRASLERWIAATGNTRLKPGRVVATDGDTITADVVTVDKEALVQRFAVNRHTGNWQQVR